MMNIILSSKKKNKNYKKKRIGYIIDFIEKESIAIFFNFEHLKKALSPIEVTK